MNAAKEWTRWIGLLLKGSLLVLATGALGGASCHLRSCDDDDSFDDDDDGGFDDDDDSFDDDDDGGCDDDDDGSASSTGGRRGGAATEVDWVLREYTLVRSDDPGAHPVRSLLDVRGFSLSAKLGAGVFTDAHFADFAARLLAANEPLLGLPPQAGRHAFAAVEHGPDFVLVSCAQELVRADGLTAPVPGAETALIFDLHGRLLEIENATRVDVGLPAPPVTHDAPASSR
jgi:hypothetical protein